MSPAVSQCGWTAMPWPFQTCGTTLVHVSDILCHVTPLLHNILPRPFFVCATGVKDSQLGRLNGWASVLKTKSSRLMTSGGEKIR